MAGGLYRFDLTPRQWQSNALDRWLKSGYRGIVSVVTGGGKTAFAHLCISELQKRVSDVRTIIVVPTLVLLDQWYVSLQEDLNVPQGDIVCFSGEEKNATPGAVNIVVINTARRTAGAIGDHPRTFLIVDECHRAGSPKNAKGLRGRHFAALGLSATPVREYDDGFSVYIEPALGKVIYEYDYRQARIDGVISPFSVINVEIPLLPDEAAKYDRLTRAAARAYDAIEKRGESDDRVSVLLQRRARVCANATMRIPVAAKIAEEHGRSRTLLFHERIAAAERIGQNLRMRGLQVTTYHSGLSPGTRRDNLRLFRRGAFDILVTCRALDEGLNVPNTETAIVASASASRRQRIQRLGRVLRPAPGKEIATIYSLYATQAERNRLAEEATGLEGVASVEWREVARPSGWEQINGDRQ